MPKSVGVMLSCQREKADVGLLPVTRSFAPSLAQSLLQPDPICRSRNEPAARFARTVTCARVCAPPPGVPDGRGRAGHAHQSGRAHEPVPRRHECVDAYARGCVRARERVRVRAYASHPHAGADVNERVHGRGNEDGNVHALPPSCTSLGISLSSYQLFRCEYNP